MVSGAGFLPFTSVNYGHSKLHSRRAYRVVRGLVRRLCVSLGGRKMMQLARPAIWWVFAVWLLGMCSTVRGASYHQHSLGEGTYAYQSPTFHGVAQVSSVTVNSFNESTGVASITYHIDMKTGALGNGAFMYSTTGIGGPASSGAVVFDLGADGVDIDATITPTLTLGTWYAITARWYNIEDDRTEDYVVYWQAGETVALFKKHRYAGTNNRSYTVKALILSATNDIVWQSGEIAPGGSWDHTADVTYRTDGPFRNALLVPAELGDGIWQVVDLEDGTIVDTSDPVEPEPMPDGSEVEPVPDNESPALPGSAPNSGTAQQGAIWQATAATVDNERLDKTTYRQGVDRLDARLALIEKAMNATTTRTVSAVTPDSLDEDGTAPATPGNILPTAPTFFSGSFTTATTMSATLPGFTALGRSYPSQSWSFDLTEYATPIGLLRACLLAALTVGFFLLCVRSARGSSADQS